MDLLTKLTPAETLMLIKPTQSRLRDLMKFTLMDLIIREVLHVTNLEEKPIQGRPMLAFSRVIAGKNFAIEKPALHEMVFLLPYYKKRNLRLVFKHLIRIAYSRARGEERFKSKYLLDSPHLKELIRIGFWQRLLGTFALSEAGKKSRDEVILYFNRLDKELPKLLNHKDEKGRALLKQIKGNVLLLNAFRFELMELIGREIAQYEDEVE